MFKRIALVSTIIFPIPTLLATNAQKAHHFYAGLNVSLSSMNGKRTDKAEDMHGEQTYISNGKKFTSRGLYSGVIGGYIWRTGNFGVGPDISYNYGQNQHTVEGRLSSPGVPQVISFDIQYKTRNQAHINIRAGYFIKNYFLYALCGPYFQSGDYYVKARRDDGSADLLEFKKIPKKKSNRGFSWGFGAQKEIAENWDVGAEYKITNVSRTNLEFHLQESEETKLISTIKYTLHTFALRLIYKF